MLKEKEDLTAKLKIEAERQHHAEALKPLLSKWQLRAQIPPVLLLTGTSGIGKTNAAHFLAQWILCEDRADGTPCDICTGCKKVISHQHTNLIEIPLDEDHLKVDSFRKIKSSTSLGIHESPYQVVLLPNAHRMTHQAANSILKLLEEPPKGWIFILTTEDVSLLPATLISRCQQFPLRPFTGKEILGFLQQTGMESEKMLICSKLAQGSLDRALHYGEDDIWDQRRDLIAFLNQPAQMLSGLMEWILKEDFRLSLTCDLFEGHLSELIQWSASPLSPSEFEWSNSDLKPLILQHIRQTLDRFKNPHAASLFWIDRIEGIAQVRMNKTLPLNGKIMVQGMLLPWLEIG